MKLHRTLILVLAMAAVAALSARPCYAQGGEENKEDIWTEDERDRTGGERRRPELTDEEINRVIASLKKSNPAKAEELQGLRKKDPQQFQAELRKHGGEEYGKIVRERFEGWRRRRREEFLQWLGKNFHKEADELAKSKQKGDEVYDKQYELIRNKLRRIYEAWRRNPDWGKVLKEDLQLKNRRDDILEKLKAATDEKKRKELTEQLREVLAGRYDLIVRRKQIIFEQLLRRLKDLEKQIERSKDEIRKWRNDKNKCENVKKRLKDLMAESSKPKTD